MRFRAPVHVDSRGRLLVVEHSTLPYTPSRVFVVTGAPSGVSRGDHVVPCRQTIVLVTGGANVTLTYPDGAESHERLESVGDAVHLQPEQFVTYSLDDPASTIIVFAEAPYRAPT